MPRVIGGIVASALLIVFLVAAGLAVVAIGRPIVEQQRGSAAAPGAAPSGDAYHQLVDRLLAAPFPAPDGSFQMQEVRLVPGALPSDVTVDIPVPSGARLVGSALRTRAGKPAGLDVVLDVPGTAADAQATYEKELVARGWSVPQNRGYTPGGFAAATPALYRMYCKGTSAPWLNTSVYPAANGPADLRVHVELTTSLPANAMGPCDTSRTQVAPPMPMNKLPPLRSPDGVSLRGNGGGSGGDRQESSATAKTAKRAAELEAAFADQLAAAAWQRVDHGSQGAVAWSTWKLPGEGDWQGLLLVRETGADSRSLLLVAESTSAASSGGGVYYSGGWSSLTGP